MRLFGQPSGATRAIGVVAIVTHQMLVLIRYVVQKQTQLLECRHELVVTFQRGMEFGAIDDHVGFGVVAHLLEGKRTADHVAGEALAAFGIVSFAADAIMYGEAGMAPGFHALGKIGAEHTFGGEEFQHLAAQRFTECCLGQRRQHSERAGGEKYAVGNHGMGR